MSLRTLAVLAVMLVVQAGPPAVRNGGFEEGDPGAVPAGWLAPPTNAAGGYRVSLSEDSPKSGARAALLARDPGTKPAGFGNLMQRLDATPFRDRRVTLRASVRVSPGSRAQLWMRVDRPGGVPGFFDNMADRPVMSPSWAEYRIEGNVHSDAESIYFGMMLLGDGRAWLDDVSVESVALTVRAPAPPRPFAGHGLDNVVAFTKLLGYVRYFHPSDEAAHTDWDAFAIENVSAIEGAPTAETLARALNAQFKAVAPTLRVFALPAEPPPLPRDLKPSPPARRAVMWRHRGVGVRAGGRGPYASERWTADLEDGKLPAGMANPAEPLVVDLGRGVRASLPLALWDDGTGTLPRGASGPAPAHPISTSPADRATRLADVALAWNVFQHFYPYFDVVQADWSVSLRHALSSAATDAEDGFATTLRKLVADLHDGHGRVSAANQPFARLPLAWDWIEGQLVVTAVSLGGALRVGDVVTAIDGVPVSARLGAEERLISAATPQWRRYLALQQILLGPEGEAPLTLAADGAPREVRLRRAAGRPVQEPRPDPISEVRPAIMYVDLGRISNDQFAAALPQLAQAKGIVFDLRGYPSLMPAFLQHLTDVPLQSAQWLVPQVTRPDREGWTFDGGGRWNLQPLAPHLTARVVFMTDGRAISYAESCLGIVEHYKLGEIVGGPTAGTNGDINPFTLPGGYTITWTGMKVVKHDGSRHHGVGIQPTIPVGRSIAGVRAGRDEVLMRAIEAAQGSVGKAR